MSNKTLKSFINKTVAYLLVLSMIASIVPQRAFAAPADILGNLKITLRLDVPEKLSSVSTKNLKMDLFENAGKLAEINLGDAITQNKTISIDGNNYPVVITAKNEKAEIATDLIHYYDLEALNVPVGTYWAKFSGNGYRDFTSPKAKIDFFSKQIIVGTSDNGFTLGDVNSDGKVDKTDLSLIESNLGTQNNQYDLNLDGVIDITDIAYVNHHINPIGEAKVFDTTLIAYANTDIKKTQDALPVDKFTINGDIENIYKANTAPVTITPISGEIISIPTEFKTPVELEQISLVTPSSNGGISEGNAIVTYIENGKEVSEEISFSANIQSSRARSVLSRNAQNTVTIDLGKRVPVKKVTINVTKVIGSDGSPSFVVVEEIKFLKDIVPENPRSDDGVVTNLAATSAEKSVDLTWTAAKNVTGYKIYYGIDINKLTGELIVDTNSASVKGLDNLVKHYFTVVSMSGDWESGKSEIVSAIPQPKSIPLPPDGLAIEPDNGMLSVTWKKAKDTETYSLYYRKKGETTYKNAISGTLNTYFTITGLENNAEYEIYATGSNKIGESRPSLLAIGIPGLPEIIEPNLPTVRKISNDNIAKVEMSHPGNVEMSFYPDGFDVSNVIDENYNTHWTALKGKFWENKEFIFEFATPKTMDYMIYVPRLDGRYKESLSQYKIKTWDSNGNYINHAGTDNLDDSPYIPNASTIKTLGYAVLPFAKTENIAKIAVEVRQINGSPTDISLSEVAFYEYYDMQSRINALFTDETLTELNSNVTSAQIDTLLSEINNELAVFLNKEAMLVELNLASALSKGDTSSLGIIKTDIIQRSAAIDNTTHGKSANSFQALGLIGSANQKITIYAKIPQGETVTIVPTQFFAEVANWQGQPIVLTSGRNDIVVPKIGDGTWDKGGALYLEYSGTAAKDIKLHILGGSKIPVLSLDDFATISETAAKTRISTYIDELVAYIPTFGGNPQHKILNSTEISMPHVLLSMPATQILKGIKGTSQDKDVWVQNVYNNTLAWEELMLVMNKTHGIDSDIKPMQTRQNIRYMRMFGNAFMYAAGSHVGIGFNETEDMIKGSPTSTLQNGAIENNLFGWGIAHEIGHNYDMFGKAELTNNIYSILGQTYDGNNNILPSRLELSNKYEEVYKKVSKSAKGESNDVFVQLALYYQLHLAYDNDKSDIINSPLNFYNQVSKEWRAGTANTFTDQADRFAIVASKVAKKDLTEFFTRWGSDLSKEAIAAMSTMGNAETRALYYMNDETRRYRLSGGRGLSQDISLTSQAVVNTENPKQVDITINHAANDSDVLGYEISRNGKAIAFTQDKTFSDLLGSANNMAFSYSVSAIDMLGNKLETSNAGEIKISYDKTINPSLYTSETLTDGTMLITFNDVTTVSGIKITGNIPNTGNFEIKSTSYDNAKDTDYVVAKSGTFTKNDITDNAKFINYFNKPGTNDTRIWNFDSKTIKISGIPQTTTLEFIEYPGDDITISENAIGKLSKDYRYGTEIGDVITAGTVIITGTYRGDPLYNTIMMQGQYSNTSGIDDSQHIEERPINGYSLLFAEIPDDGAVSEISDGFYIFVPDMQAESDFDGTHTDGEACIATSLPLNIKAELYRTIDPSDATNKRLTSNTLWITSPSESTMPEIVLAGA